MSDNIDRPKPLSGQSFKNNPITFTFLDTDKFPFYAQESEFNGKKVMKYGYKIKSLEHQADTVFLTEKANDIIKAAGCVRGEEVTMELRTGTTEDGKNWTLWFLNDQTEKDLLLKAISSTDDEPATKEQQSEVKSEVKSDIPEYGSLGKKIGELDVLITDARNKLNVIKQLLAESGKDPF